MADDKLSDASSNTTKMDPPKGAEMVSLDDIDALLSEADPGFSESLKELAHDTTLNEATLVAEQGISEDQVEVEVPWIEKYPRLAAYLGPLFSFLGFFSFLLIPFKFLSPKLKKFKLYIASRRILLRNWIILQAKEAYRFAKEDLPKHTLQAIQISKDYLKFQQVKLRKFNARPFYQKLLFFFSCLLLVFSFGVLYQGFKGGWLSKIRSGDLTDFTSHADKNFEFDPNNDLVLFYRAFPQPDFTVLLNKFIVNLRSEPGHLRPMGFFHLYLNCDSQDTAIEIKDREKEITDLLQRVAEDFTYTEINSKLGEKKLKDSLRNEVNRILNQGRVLDIFINHLVTKP